MPGFGPRDIGPAHRTADRCSRHLLNHGRVTAFLGRDRARVALTCVLVSIREFGRRNGRHDEPRAKALRQLPQQSGAKARDVPLLFDARCGEFLAPHPGVPSLRLGKLQEQISAQRIAFGRSYLRVKSRPVQFVPQVDLVALDVVGGHVCCPLTDQFRRAFAVS